MKTIILLFACLFFSSKSYGQSIVNSEFEAWAPVPNSFGGMDPQGWQSTNAATAGSNVEAISMSTDKYSGAYALALSPLSSSSVTDTLTSAIVSGQAPLDFSTYQLDYAKGGQAFTTMATSVNGYYKFSKGDASYDSAYAVVLLKDALGSGYKGIGKLGFIPSASYVPFQVNIVHQGAAGGQVDSLVIAFFYKSNDQSPVSTGKLLIDSLYYKVAPVATTIIKEAPDESFNLFPNPFSEAINLKFKKVGNYRIEIFSANGLLCQEHQLKDICNQLLSLRNFEKGIYFIRCTNLDNGTFFSKPICKE